VKDKRFCGHRESLRCFLTKTIVHASIIVPLKSCDLRLYRRRPERENVVSFQHRFLMDSATFALELEVILRVPFFVETSIVGNNSL
jgi:hypothetical protein